MLATVIDVDALLKVILAALGAGAGVTAAFSFVILGSTRFAERRQQGRPLAAGAFGLLAALALAACVLALIVGLRVMISK